MPNENTLLGDCPLPVALQRRNMVCYAGLWCLIYLSAPISYVGVTHANLLKELGNSDTVSYLPHAVYQWMTAFPVLVAWFLPQPRLLKPLVVWSLVVKLLVTAMVVLAVALQWPATVVSATVVGFAALFGAANGVLITALWEVLRRGVSTDRRGSTLGWSFGVGPVLACVGSIVQQCLLSKEPLTGYTFGLAFPMNYLALFAAALPVMALSVVLGALFVVPTDPEEVVRPSRLSEITAGLREFFTYRPLFLGAIAYLLVYSGGNAIFDAVSLHAKDVLGDSASETVGIQNFLRFGFKAVAGGLLGWLLARTHPKATLLTTTGLLLFALGWVLNSSGWWFLASAGWLGAGELFGAYFPNYVATASAKDKVRANIAYLNLLGALVGFASVLFGQISDRFGRIATFQTATGILLFAMVLIVFALPARPVPQE
jgi:MFS family permease